MMPPRSEPHLARWILELPARRRTPAALSYLGDCLQGLVGPPDPANLPRWLQTDIAHRHGMNREELLAWEEARRRKREFLEQWRQMRKREKKARRSGVLLPPVSDETPSQVPARP